MRLTPLSSDSDTETLKFNAREVATLARAVILVQDLATLRYPGSDEVLTWLMQLQDDATPLHPTEAKE